MTASFIPSLGLISRIAGTGSACRTAPVCGDNGPATSAQLDNPFGIAVDAAGDVYIADTDDQEIRKIAPDGTITRIAGIHGLSCRSAPDCGDDRPATSATLAQPLGVAVDAAGNLYIADAGDSEVRKIAANGTITRIAGTGKPCMTAPSCGDLGPTTNAQLNVPEAIAVDSDGSIFIADTADKEIRKIAVDGTITRFAGTGRTCNTQPNCGDGGPALQAGLYAPQGVAVSGAHVVYIADSGNYEVRAVGNDGTITRIVGTGTPCMTAPSCGDGGPATGAQLRSPQGVAVDAAGNIDIADTLDQEIRQVRP